MELASGSVSVNPAGRSSTCRAPPRRSSTRGTSGLAPTRPARRCRSPSRPPRGRRITVDDRRRRFPSPDLRRRRRVEREDERRRRTHVARHVGLTDPRPISLIRARRMTRRPPAAVDVVLHHRAGLDAAERQGRVAGDLVGRREARCRGRATPGAAATVSSVNRNAADGELTLPAASVCRTWTNFVPSASGEQVVDHPPPAKQ